MSQKQKILLIDGFAMMFRAFYAVRFSPVYKGVTINAVYGCATTIMQAIEQFKPEFVVAAFDAPEKTFRHKKDDQYKAQRKKAPDEFIPQIPIVQDLVKAFNIPLIIKPGFEADDTIGTLAKKAEAQNIESYILSGDLDFLQLTSEHIHLAKFNGKEPLIFTPEKTFEKIGVNPHQIVDYKAICGDSSDNYKGIPGIGPKGAVNLLTEYKTLENIYQNLDKLAPKIQEKFKVNRDYAFHCQYLAQIHLEVPVDEYNFENYELPTSNIIDFYKEIGFNALIRRISNLDNNIPLDEKKSKPESPQMSLF